MAARLIGGMGRAPPVFQAGVMPKACMSTSVDELMGDGEYVDTMYV